jgi:phosphopantothenoylcysteine decarboxylase / phosphopantothenate---cysteine ligase
LMAAAVADYRPAQAESEKRSKDGGAWNLELEPTPDVLAELGSQQANGRVLVGFAAETGADGIARARAKLTRKGVDLIVYNDVGRDDIGFDAAENEVVLVTATGEQQVAKAPKEVVAAAILDRAEELMEEAGGPAGRG